MNGNRCARALAVAALVVAAGCSGGSGGQAVVVPSPGGHGPVTVPVDPQSGAFSAQGSSGNVVTVFFQNPPSGAIGTVTPGMPADFVPPPLAGGIDSFSASFSAPLDLEVTPCSSVLRPSHTVDATLSYSIFVSKVPFGGVATMGATQIAALGQPVTCTSLSNGPQTVRLAANTSYVFLLSALPGGPHGPP